MWDIDAEHLQSDEKIEYSDRPNLLSCWLSFLWTAFMLFGFIMIGIVGMVMSSKSDDKATTLGLVAMGLTYLVFALPAIIVILRRLSTRYAISSRGLISRSGILTTSMKSVPFKHLTSIEVRETLTGKLFHYGHLLIDTSGSGKAIELRWKFVKAPHKVKKLIESHLGENRRPVELER